MPDHVVPTCTACGHELVLQIDPAAPRAEHARVLLADPPFRFVCREPGCSDPGTID